MEERNCAILQTIGLTKDFGGLRVIDDLNLTVNRGELRCIIGPNGAGKTTLFNLITGDLRPSAGSIVFSGVDLTRKSVREIALLGVCRKYQVPNVFGAMTIEDNLRVVLDAKSRNFQLLFCKEQPDHEEKVSRILDSIRLTHRRKATAGELSHGERQWLEIGLVLASEPKLLLLDEPTAGMTSEETMETARLIRRLTKDLTTIVIEHDISFVREIAEKITVLHKGAILAEGTLGEIESNPTVREVYLGGHHDAS